MNLNIEWQGNLPLENIKWGRMLCSEYLLPPELDEERKIYWKDHLKENPTDYDGNLLFLERFDYRNDELILDIGLISFSTVVFMARNKLSVDKGVGMLGIQCLIFSPCHNYILVGERPLSQPYYPGAITVPGGMLELEDIEMTPKEALLREIYEETPFQFHHSISLEAILSGWNNVSVTFLTSVTIMEDYNFDPSDIIKGDKKEWENNLRWLPIEELKSISPNKLLDGLLFYQKRIFEQNKTSN
ncbi:MAG: NUDIX hydrolase [Candidatus Hermodarchaeota archaeon]